MTAEQVNGDDADVARMRPDVSRWMVQVPETVRARWLRDGAPTGRPLEWVRPAREEVAQEVRDHQRAILGAAYLRRIPERYRDARLASLDGEQTGDGTVPRWWDAGGQNLVLVGAAGAGKTYTAYAVGNHAALERRQWVHAITAADLNDALRPGADNLAADWRRLTESDLLILDDIGRERLVEWTVEQLWRVIDARARGRRRTVWTTNLPYDERGFRWAPTPAGASAGPNLLDRYGNSIIDRMFDDATVVSFQAPSRRRPAAPY